MRTKVTKNETNKSIVGELAFFKNFMVKEDMDDLDEMSIRRQTRATAAVKQRFAHLIKTLEKQIDRQWYPEGLDLAESGLQIVDGKLELSSLLAYPATGTVRLITTIPLHSLLTTNLYPKKPLDAGDGIHLTFELQFDRKSLQCQVNDLNSLRHFIMIGGQYPSWFIIERQKLVDPELPQLLLSAYAKLQTEKRLVDPTMWRLDVFIGLQDDVAQCYIMETADSGDHGFLTCTIDEAAGRLDRYEWEPRWMDRNDVMKARLASGEFVSTEE
jgi:hypothetical protein